MSLSSSSYARRRRPRRRRGRTLLWLVALVVVFALGIGLGEALHDQPKPGGTQTSIRTLHPLPLAPVAGGTAAATTSNP